MREEDNVELQFLIWAVLALLGIINVMIAYWVNKQDAEILRIRERLHKLTDLISEVKAIVFMRDKKR